MEKKKRLFVVFILVVVTGIGYNVYRLRQQPVSGFSCGSQKIPDSSLRNYYIFRFNTANGPNGISVKEPMYAILWKSRPSGPTHSSSWHLVKMILGGDISVPKKEKTIYALQPDFTLSALPLKEVDVNALFDLFLATGKRELFHENNTWRSQIAPNLIIVDIPNQ